MPAYTALDILYSVNALEKIVRDTFKLEESDDITPVVEDIETLFALCECFAKLDSGASLAAQRKIFASLKPSDVRSDADIDDAVLSRIGMFLPGGPIRLFTNDDPPSESELGAAIEKARQSLGPVKRGRSPGTISLAMRQLALGLAHIWKQQALKSPSRKVLKRMLQNGEDVSEERGSYNHFVNDVFEVAPSSLRKPRKGKVPTANYIARLGIAELKKREQDGSEAALRGLLPESLWLGKKNP